MSILSRPDLDAAQCSTPGCLPTLDGFLWLRSTCHPDAGLWVGYDGGVLYLVCIVCQRGVARIAVHTPPEDGMAHHSSS